VSREPSKEKNKAMRALTKLYPKSVTLISKLYARLILRSKVKFNKRLLELMTKEKLSVSTRG
jgi:hypothetical protein